MPRLDFRVADGEDSTMKEIIQSLLGILGFGLIRLQKQPLDSFFSLLKQQGFAPKHVIDVGANHGNWTRVAFNYFPDAYYTLVEPQDWLKTYVQDILARNGKIRWIGAGVGDKPGTLPFHVSHRDDSSTFVFTPEEAKAEGFRQIEVPVTTLNDIARTSDAPFPDMVKIDAEGLDLRVLAGASEFIGKTDIFLLEAAICPQNLENTLGNVIQTMAQADYRIIDITELNRSPKCGALWLCEVAFLRNGSRLLDRLEYE